MRSNNLRDGLQLSFIQNSLSVPCSLHKFVIFTSKELMLEFVDMQETQSEKLLEKQNDKILIKRGNRLPISTTPGAMLGGHRQSQGLLLAPDGRVARGNHLQQ